jgi:creatinine amidohydrolase
MPNPSREPIYLSEIPNEEAGALVATGAPVIVFFNPVEYHGPHLPLDTDSLLSFGAISETYNRMRDEGTEWPLLIYSTLRVGCGAVPTRGTVHHRYREVRRMMLDTCRGLRTLGAKRVILMTFHGEPHHNLAIDDGVKLLRSWGIQAMAPMNVIMTESVEMKIADYDSVFATIPDERERTICRDTFSADFHAGFFETSLMLHWRPEAVGKAWKSVPPCPPLGSMPLLRRIAGFFRARGRENTAREIEFAEIGILWSKIRPVLGYTGRPALANAEAGRLFAERMTALISKAILGYFVKQIPPPEPIWKWIRVLSLGARIG